MSSRPQEQHNEPSDDRTKDIHHTTDTTIEISYPTWLRKISKTIIGTLESFFYRFDICMFVRLLTLSQTNPGF